MANRVLDEFTTAYVECALWSSTDNSTESGGYPLDKNYTIDDIHPDSLAKMIADCKKFQEDNAEHISTWESSRTSDDEQAGHDFWLTRVQSGAGFNDGDWDDEASEALTSSSHEFGECWLYVGDDGVIHIM